MFALIAVGVVGLLVAVQVGQQLAGLVVYAVAVVVAFAILGYVRYSDDLSMGDERETELERRASHLTFEVLGYSWVFVAVALFLLDATGRASIGPQVRTLMNAFVVVCGTWVVSYLWLRFGP
jgi:uncharacterized membrane protein